MVEWLAKPFLKIVTIDDVLRVEGGSLFIGKRKLTAEELIALKAEAKAFEHSQFYNLLLKNLFWLSNYKMMKEADKEMEMVNGRMMTYILSAIEEFVDRFRLLR